MDFTEALKFLELDENASIDDVEDKANLLKREKKGEKAKLKQAKNIALAEISKRALQKLGLDENASIDDIEKKCDVIKRKLKYGDDIAEKIVSLEKMRKNALYEPSQWDRLFIKLSCEESIIIYFATSISNFLRSMSLIYWYAYFFKRKDKKCKCITLAEVNLRSKEVEGWVFFLLGIEFIALWYAKPTGFYCINDLFIIIAVYGLINIFGVTIDELLQPIKRSGGYIRIKNVSRWLLLTGVNILQIILCFAILIKSYGYQFVNNTKTITDGLTAFYQSLVTFTTLGYGDYVPTTPKAKLIVIFEVIFFLIMIGFKLPMAVSIIKVKVYKRH